MYRRNLTKDDRFESAQKEVCIKELHQVPYYNFPSLKFKTWWQVFTVAVKHRCTNNGHDYSICILSLGEPEVKIKQDTSTCIKIISKNQRRWVDRNCSYFKFNYC